MQKICFVNQTTSTNVLMKEIISSEKPEEGFVVYTDFQTSGKGQGSNQWESEPGKNLLFTILLYPHHIHAAEQFIISQIASIALTDVLAEFCQNVKIKWPNDIYIDDRKIAGILIENMLQGSAIKRSVIGIGLNVNQQKFVSDAPNPVSLRQLTLKSYNRKSLLLKILTRFFELYQCEDYKILKQMYFKRLYRADGFYTYSSGGKFFNAKIKNILDDGRLLLQQNDGKEVVFGFKEVEFFIPH